MKMTYSRLSANMEAILQAKKTAAWQYEPDAFDGTIGAQFAGGVTFV